MINFDVMKMEFRRSIKSFLAWTLIIGFTMYVIIIVYPMVKDMYSQIPEEFMDMMDMFGGLPDNLIEYVGLEGGVTMQVFASIYAAIVGFTAITREVNEQSTDLIYTLPLSRTTFYFSKLLAAIMQILAFAVAIFLFFIFGFISLGPIPNLESFILYYLANTLMLIIFVILGFYLGTLLTKRNRPMISLLIPLPLYIISFISSLTNKWLENLKYITPFTFSEPSRFLQETKDFEYISLIVYIIISIVAIIHGLYLFRKKEFTS